MIDSQRVSRDINYGGKRGSFPRSNIESGTMPRTDDLVAVDIPITDWTVIMGAYIANRKQFSCDVKYYDRPSTDFSEQPLPRG
jgi:hypothetical protein